MQQKKKKAANERKSLQAGGQGLPPGAWPEGPEVTSHCARSVGMAERVLFRRGTGQSDDSDVWDDTALIKAYDKAVASFKNALRNGECSEPSDRQDQRLRMKRKNNRRNRNRKKSNAMPMKQNENETPYSTDESEKSSQSAQNKNCTKARFSPQNLRFPSPPGAPVLERPGSKFKTPPSFLSRWPPPFPAGPPLIPPPPPIGPDSSEDDEALGTMLIAWYMSGYHTGYYLGLKQSRMEAALERETHAK
ncbi:survival motor neuron protein isoform X3 [Cuculus canorus]|uniref:survival motor neuron protein isoform X3 n=1 Tax=Cuculus canorus TaxID=55661 RepID=UPI0023AA5412|nr:survival motor neuron protein isoform X3 [Cuculus canorus]